MFGSLEKITDPDLILAKDKLFQKLGRSNNYVCFDCRFNCKGGGPCPHCNNSLHCVGWQARVPGKTHDAKWKKFEKKFKPKNFVHVKYTKDVHELEPKKEKWTCILCKKEYDLVCKTDKFIFRTIPDTLQMILCDKCYDNVFEYMCSKKDECKPSNKNKPSKKNKCLKCLKQNIPKLEKKLKAIEAIKKLN